MVFGPSVLRSMTLLLKGGEPLRVTFSFFDMASTDFYGASLGHRVSRGLVRTVRCSGHVSAFDKLSR